MKPALWSSFKGYSLSRLGKDLTSGVLVAIIALPLSIALGIQSGATLQQGIITAIIAGFIISAFGGSKVQIGGPTAAFVTIIVGYIASIGLLGLHMATVMAGIIMICLGLFKVGGLVKYIPYPIVIGFTSGIGVTLLIGQLADFGGIGLTSGLNIFGSVPEFFQSEFVNKIANLGSNMPTINFATLGIGVLTLAIMIILPKINKKIPGAFIALIVATAVTAIIGACVQGSAGIATIGSMYPDVKAEFQLPDFASIGKLNFAKLIVPAITIAFLGSVESLLSATVADNLTNTKHNSNAELVGEGLANIASGLVGGLPATGAIARTSANIQNGGSTPIAGIIHALTLLLMFFVLMPVVKFIPMTALAAVLIVVSFNMANFRLFAKLARFNARDLIILLTTFALTIYKDLVYGVIGGLVVTFAIMSTDIFAKTKIAVIEESSDSGLEGMAVPKFKIIKPNRNLTFINNVKLISYCNDNIDIYAKIIIDMDNINRVDVSSLDKIAKLERDLARNHKSLSIINAKSNISMQMTKMCEL